MPFTRFTAATAAANTRKGYGLAQSNNYKRIDMARRAHQPSPESRRYVETAAGLGALQPDIAAVIGVSPSTLLKHYRAELDTGVVKANLRVSGKLFAAATQKEHTMASITSAIFWMKSRGRWKEIHQVENVDGDGNVISPRPIVVMLPDNGRSGKPMKLVGPKTIEGEVVDRRG